MGIENQTESADAVGADAQAAIDAFEAGFKGEQINMGVTPAAEASAAGGDQSEATATAGAEPAPAAAQTAKPRKPKAPATAEGEGADDGPSDPYAGLDPRVRDALAAQATMAHQLRSVQGRVGRLQQENENLRRQVAGAPSPTAGAPAAPAAGAAAAKHAAREKVRGEMPEVAEALDELERATPRAPEPAPAASPAASPASSPPLTEAQKDAEAVALTRLDPKWGEKLNSTEFKLWTTQLPENVQEEIWGTDHAIVLAPYLQQYDRWHAAVAARATQSGGDAGQRSTTASTATARSQTRLERAAAAPAAGARGAATRQETPDEAFARGFQQVRAGTGMTTT